MLNDSACDVVRRKRKFVSLPFCSSFEERNKPMSDIKHNNFASRLAEEQLSHSGNGSAVVDAPPRTGVQHNGKEVTSWDAYRNWLTKVQAPEQRRSLPDPALFSFKGYRSWAEKIRRDWDTDEDF